MNFFTKNRKTKIKLLVFFFGGGGGGCGGGGLE